MKNSFLMAIALALSACASVDIGQHQNDFSYRSDVNLNACLFPPRLALALVLTG
jgi:hypothetical protein